MRFSFLLAPFPSTPHTYIHIHSCTTHTHPSSRGDMHSWYTVYAIEYTYCRRDPILHLTLVHVQSVPRINDVKKTDDDNDSNHLRQTRDRPVLSHTSPVLYHLRWFPRFLLGCVSDLIINNRPNIANTDDIWKDVLTLCSSYRLDLSLSVCLSSSFGNYSTHCRPNRNCARVCISSNLSHNLSNQCVSLLSSRFVRVILHGSCQFSLVERQLASHL